ncbi:MAG: hypothetical protein ACW7DP_08965 [Paraglaciecola chathamensis]
MKLLRLPCIVLISCMSVTCLSVAQTPSPHILEQTTGLKRFDSAHRLSGENSRSTLDIKQIHIGDNVLASAIPLYDQGAKLHHIAGSSRSDKVRLSFYQPYQNSRLEQRIALHFNKFNGFITQIDSLYTVESAYVGIKDVLKDVLSSAIAKYGEPISLADARKQTNTPQGDVALSAYIQTLKPRENVANEVLAFFNDLRVSRSAKFVGDEAGHALLHSGFNRCYLWQRDSYNQMLTLCFFPPNSANSANRGVELQLVDFAVQKKIAATQKIRDELSLSL